jgi:asparagine synthase (glutamine-hydrolysing)
MCGLIGFWGSHTAQYGELIKEKCLPRLRFRGPDELRLEEYPKDGLLLGHARLKILDLSSRGRQPMRSPDGQHVIVYNGEIYNFCELRQEMENLGEKFLTQTDTEVFLRAFQLWGPAAFLRFNGMWAAAIYDFSEKKLFLTRDRFGKKPLFWAKIQDGFVFASEIKAILPFLPHGTPNRLLLRNTGLFMNYEATEDCVVEEIRRFPAGNWGEVKHGEVMARPYWNTLDHLPKVPQRYEEQVELVREIFVDSCRLRMRSDVPVGTALSGGLDSSATIAVMAHLGQRDTIRQAHSWQNAFTASFPGSFLDETAYAREVCDHLRIPFHPVCLSGEKALQNLPEDIWKFEEVYIAAPSPFMEVYRCIREAGTVVTLDGHGADELFGGYPFDYLEAIYDTGISLSAALEILKTWESQWPQNTDEYNPPYSSRWKYLARVWIRRWKRIIQGKIPAPKVGMEKLPDGLARRLYESTHTTILPTLLRNYDRYSMAHGVEIRMPFMDHRLVSLAMALPWTSKIRKGYTKAVLRDAVAPFLPASIACRKSKIGFNPPASQWMRGPWKTFLLDTLESREFRECSLIDPPKSASAVREALDSPEFAKGENAWKEITPFFWEKYFWRRHQSGEN